MRWKLPWTARWRMLIRLPCSQVKSRRKNSFEEPEKVHDVLQEPLGCIVPFYYTAPAYSVNVLRLVKVQD